MNTQLDNALRFHQSALNLRAKRQEILAANIANADTPHFKARDIDFGSALSGALRGRIEEPLALTATAAAHVVGVKADSPSSLLYRNEAQASVDGNTVNLDLERAAFVENAMHYEASITFINGLLRTMQQAVAGQ